MAAANKNKASEPRQATRDEIPRDEILALQTSYSEVRLEINRQSPQGHWIGIRKGIVVPPVALFDLQSPLEELAGGGTFVITVQDPNTKQVILPRWRESYDGTPKQPMKGYTIGWLEDQQRLALVPQMGSVTALDEPPQHGYGGMHLQQALTAVPGPMMGAAPGLPPVYEAMLQGPQPTYNRAGQMLEPPAELIPPWLKGFPAQVQWNHIMEERKKQAAAMHPGGGEVANQWIHHEIRNTGNLQAQLARAETALVTTQKQLEQKVEEIRQQTAAQVEAARIEQVRAEKELERVRHEAELKSLRAELMTVVESNKKPAFDLPALAASLAPFAPVAAAFFASKVDAQKVERESETKLLTTVLTANANKKEPGLVELITALGPVAVPFLVKFLETRGPQATAEVMQMEHEQRLVQMKMFIDMMQAMMPEPEPAWKGLIEGLMGMFAGGMQQRALLAAQNKQPAAIGTGADTRPPSTQAQPQPQPTQQASDGDSVLERMRAQDPDAAADVELVFQQLPAHLGFHTHEWLVLLFNLHARNDPAELAPMIVDHLAHCANYQLMPQPLLTVFDTPKETLETVLGILPIAKKDAVYVEQVIERAVELIAQLEVEQDEEGDEEDEPAVVTPAPNKSGLVNSSVIESS